jgi:hypothetical protein
MQHASRAESVARIEGAIVVARVDGHYRVLVTRPAAEGALLLVLEGVVVPRPSRFSVQVGLHEHLEPPAGTDIETLFDHYPWNFLNHCCEPSARLRGRELVAARELRAWDQVTFDYNANEFDMAAPFVCTCGAPSCDGFIRGYRWLTPTRRAARAGRAAAHLIGDPRRAS